MHRFQDCVAWFSIVSALIFVGCDDPGPSQVQETSQYSFDDMAAMAAEETTLSEAEE
ncbi:hypothetical protein [Rubripirellula lacrimiformis]|nr:hypothetical protein [Rubripirellula lacrimiformis]